MYSANLYNKMFLVVWLHLCIRAHENSLGNMAAHSVIEDTKDISRLSWTGGQMEVCSIVLDLPILTVRVRRFDGACLQLVGSVDITIRMPSLHWEVPYVIT